MKCPAIGEVSEVALSGEAGSAARIGTPSSTVEVRLRLLGIDECSEFEFEVDEGECDIPLLYQSISKPPPITPEIQIQLRTKS